MTALVNDDTELFRQLMDNEAFRRERTDAVFRLTYRKRSHLVESERLCYAGAVTRAYEELVDFIAGGSTSSAVVEFAASQTTKERVADLLRRGKTADLTSDERSELAHYLEIEHVMRLAKARARKFIARE